VPPVLPGREETLRRCALAPSSWLAGQRAELCIRDAATGTFAGTIGLFQPDLLTQQGMVGYGLMRQWRGRGYATRAVNLLVEWAFTHVGLVRVVAGTAPDNTASHRVLARAGFAREAYLRARLPGEDGTRVDDIQWVRLAPAHAAGARLITP
jgi:RimJ/RimL family protein N-acetyltransferase